MLCKNTHATKHMIQRASWVGCFFFWPHTKSPHITNQSTYLPNKLTYPNLRCPNSSSTDCCDTNQ